MFSRVAHAAVILTSTVIEIKMAVASAGVDGGNVNEDYFPVTDMPTRLQLQFSIVMDNCITRMKAVAGVGVKEVVENWDNFDNNKPVVKAAARCLADWSQLLQTDTAPYLIFAEGNDLRYANPEVGEFRAADATKILPLFTSCLGLTTVSPSNSNRECSEEDEKSIRLLHSKMIKVAPTMLILPTAASALTNRVAALHSRSSPALFRCS
jgi:hypothetical protein